MELSQSAQEVIMQAQMLKLDTDADFLSLEHIYYGLLLMACYKEEPMNDPETRPEARRLRAYLEKNVRSIASAKKQLLEDAKEDSSGFRDAKEALGRAAEMAGENPITPMDLAKAILEAPSPTVRALNGLVIPSAVSEDDAYHPKKAQAGQNAGKPIAADAGKISVSEPAPKPVQKPVEKPAPKPPEKPVQKPAPKPPEKPAPVKTPEKKEDSGMSVSEIIHAIQQLDKLNENQGKKPSKPVKPHGGNQNRNRRKTRFGWITWRGGAVAAGIKYFLCVLLIPAAILFAAEYFKGWVRTPPTTTPWGAFGVRFFVMLWAMMVFRGLLILLGQKTRSLTLFLRTMTDLGLITGTMYFAGRWFYHAGLFDPEFPSWIKYVGGLLAILVLCVSAALYENLRYSPLKARKTIEYAGSKGRPGKVLFQSLTRQLIFPLAVLIGLWAFKGTLENWQEKVFWIFGFLVAWSIPNTFISCTALATNASWYRGSGGGFFKFLRSLYTFLFIPLLVVFLHWLFGWFPMQLWVMIVLGVYLLAGIILSVAYAKS